MLFSYFVSFLKFHLPVFVLLCYYQNGFCTEAFGLFVKMKHNKYKNINIEINNRKKTKKKGAKCMPAVTLPGVTRGCRGNAWLLSGIVIRRVPPSSSRSADSRGDSRGDSRHDSRGYDSRYDSVFEDGETDGESGGQQGRVE